VDGKKEAAKMAQFIRVSYIFSSFFPFLPSLPPMCFSPQDMLAEVKGLAGKKVRKVKKVCRSALHGCRRALFSRTPPVCVCL
jgi:hypothetical protein